MSGKNGRKLLLKLGDGGGPETFNPIASLTSKSISLNGTEIDNTADDSVDGNDVQWTETLRGVNSISISGDAKLKNDPAETTLIALFFDAENKANWQLVIPGVGTVEGPFRLVTFDASGETTGDLTWSIQLNSAGACTFAAE